MKLVHWLLAEGRPLRRDPLFWLIFGVLVLLLSDAIHYTVRSMR